MRLNQLTFTRFIAAVAIVIFHNKETVYPFSTETFTSVIKYFNCFVTYFFVLSGFILTINTDSKLSFKRFYANRISRIYPLYCFALFLTIMLISLARTPLDKFSFDKFFLSLTLLQSWINGYALVYNFPSWSLSCEAFFYFSFPIILFLISKLRIKHSIIIISIIWSLSQFIVFLGIKNANYSVSYNPLTHFSSFLVGIAGGVLFKFKLSFLKNSISKIELVTIFSFLLITYFIISKNKIFYTFYSNGLLAPFFIVLILTISLNKDNHFHYFTNSKLQYLGEISYGVYILQFPIYIFISGILKRIGVFSTSTTFFIYLPFLIFISILTYEFIEKPSKGLIKTFVFKKIIN